MLRTGEPALGVCVVMSRLQTIDRAEGERVMFDIRRVVLTHGRRLVRVYGALGPNHEST